MFSEKGQIVTVFGFVGSVFSFTASELCHWSETPQLCGNKSIWLFPSSFMYEHENGHSVSLPRSTNSSSFIIILLT